AVARTCQASARFAKIESEIKTAFIGQCRAGARAVPQFRAPTGEARRKRRPYMESASSWGAGDCTASGWRGRVLHALGPQPRARGGSGDVGARAGGAQDRADPLLQLAR